MRSVPWLLLGLSALACDAQETKPDEAGSPSLWRSELRSEFKFHSAAVTSTATAKPASEPAPDPTIVKLAPYVVRDQAPPRGLDTAIAVQKIAPSPLAPLLGTGLHEIKMRKTTYFYYTILHIPVLVGLKW